MRIISGKFGGRRLVNFNDDHIRPTTDRVKESLFNILRDRWEGARVLDLFSGTGNLGLEAISWGAQSVEAVEKHPRSIEIIYENMKLLGVQSEIRVVRSDVSKYLKKYEGDPFDVILVDPPFTECLANEVLTVLSTSRVLAPHSRVAIESASREKVLDRYDKLVRVDTRNFGDKILSFYELER